MMLVRAEIVKLACAKVSMGTSFTTRSSARQGLMTRTGEQRARFKSLCRRVRRQSRESTAGVMGFAAPAAAAQTQAATSHSSVFRARLPERDARLRFLDCGERRNKNAPVSYRKTGRSFRPGLRVGSKTRYTGLSVISVICDWCSGAGREFAAWRGGRESPSTGDERPSLAHPLVYCQVPL